MKSIDCSHDRQHALESIFQEADKAGEGKGDILGDIYIYIWKQCFRHEAVLSRPGTKWYQMQYPIMYLLQITFLFLQLHTILSYLYM